jgi:hypothetical protein
MVTFLYLGIETNTTRPPRLQRPYPPRDNNKKWLENNEASVLERLSRKLKTKILHWKARQNYGTGATISYEISDTSGTVR